MFKDAFDQSTRKNKIQILIFTFVILSDNGTKYYKQKFLKEYLFREIIANI